MTDVALKTAVNEIGQGLVDVNLSGGVIKKRVPIEEKVKALVRKHC